MILVILAIALVVLFTGIILYNRGHYNLMESIGEALSIIGGVSTVVAFIVLVILTFASSFAATVDEKIIMYQEENAKIEEQIAAVVSQYQEHESEIFKDAKVSSDSAITLVSLYPELKSDELVKSQIDIYVANNEKIKELRSDQINRKVYNWWLYFGGE